MTKMFLRESQEENSRLREQILELEERIHELENKDKRKMVFSSLSKRVKTVLGKENII
jgi:cell division septum initiation protein DivIVA